MTQNSAGRVSKVVKTQRLSTRGASQFGHRGLDSKRVRTNCLRAAEQSFSLQQDRF